MSHRDLSLSLAQALLRSNADASQRSSPDAGKQTPPKFTITISREIGARGNSVATEVGRRLDWPVYDRNILDKIAEELHRPISRLETLDERPATWLGECVGGLLDKSHVGADTYLKHLFAAVRDLGVSGRCVIVGRGANFLLPAETTLRVRLVAHPEDRARVVAGRLGLSPREAADWIEKTEGERVAFVKSTFRADATDPHHYDLVLNMSSLGVAEAADIITDIFTLRLRRLERRAATAGLPGEKGAAGVLPN